MMALLGLIIGLQLLLKGSFCYGNVSVMISVPPSPGVSVLVTPAEHPIVRGVGETLTLTCTLLPAIPPNQQNVSNKSISNANSSHTEILQKLMGLRLHTLSSERDHENRETWEEGAPLLRWIMPINAPERVREERLGGGAVAGMASVRVVVRELRETDSGNYTCELPHHQLAAVAELHVMHRDVVQQCGLQSFQCNTGECIPQRFVCDAKSDCPGGTDEQDTLCGQDKCSGKLACDNGRCLDPVRCCRPLHPISQMPAQPPPHPANCSINPAIRCCRKLMHPAALDQDLYYLATRPRPHQARHPNSQAPPSPLLIGSLVAVVNIATVCLVLVLRQRLWPHGVVTSPHQTFSVTQRSLAWWRDGGSGPLWGRLSRQRSHCSQRRPPPPRASGDIISMTALSAGPLSASPRGGGGGVIAPPQFCHVPPASTPPPSYQAVCGPPPPYTSEPAPPPHSTVFLPLLSLSDTGVSSVVATSASGISVSRPSQQQTTLASVPLHQISPSHLRLLMQSCAQTPAHPQLQCLHDRNHDDTDAVQGCSRSSNNSNHEAGNNIVCNGNKNLHAQTRRDNCRRNQSHNKSGAMNSVTARGSAGNRPLERNGSTARDARLNRLLQNTSTVASVDGRNAISSKLSSHQPLTEPALEPLLQPPSSNRSQPRSDASVRSHPKDHIDRGTGSQGSTARPSDTFWDESQRSTNCVFTGRQADKNNPENSAGDVLNGSPIPVNLTKNNNSALGLVVSPSSNTVEDSNTSSNKINDIKPSASGPALACNIISATSNSEGPETSTVMPTRSVQGRSPRTATVHTSFRRSRTREPLPVAVRHSATLPAPRRHHHPARPDSPSSTSSSSTCLAPSSDSLCSFSSSSSSSSS